MSTQCRRVVGTWKVLVSGVDERQAKNQARTYKLQRCLSSGKAFKLQALACNE